MAEENERSGWSGGEAFRFPKKGDEGVKAEDDEVPGE
jgi:hypothetical protein